jgi:hypothetical protein
MKALDKAVVSLQSLIVSANALAKDAEQNRIDIREALLSLGTLEAQWEYVGTRLMPVILKAKAYSTCRIEKTNRGSYQFVDKTTGKRHEGARSFLRDRLSLTTLLAGSTNKHTRFKSEPKLPGTRQREFVLKAFNLLSAADRRWVLANAK